MIKINNREIINSFMTYFDGVGIYIEPISKVSTYELGLCDLKIENEKLLVTLRRPGLLIGKQGADIKALEEYLNIKIKIIEKKFI